MPIYSFDIGLGVHSVSPSPNYKKLSKTEYNNQLAINIAKNSNLPVKEVKECMRYGTSVCV
ncbi:hypothetical protein [Vagococcus fluvialis]|uniref:hypothetical protein n=1 Tax=Vagococcus fluvialis TaxID=2738 RepID=UPI001D0B2E34|nr:hypothetical protein [Vagococcus fluvialis]UDM79579.1 hypothetical protein K5K97_12930 [Vagococcus fluvialis]